MAGGAQRRLTVGGVGLAFRVRIAEHHVSTPVGTEADRHSEGSDDMGTNS